jgi:hypothetical protein
MTPDAHRRLAEIAAEQSRLAEEAAALIAALSGAPERATDCVAGADHRQVEAIDRENLLTIPQAAAEWKCSARTMRKRADQYGAIVKVGGSIYVDRIAYGRGVNFQNLQKFSISRPARIADNSTK